MVRAWLRSRVGSVFDPSKDRHALVSRYLPEASDRNSLRAGSHKVWEQASIAERICWRAFPEHVGDFQEKVVMYISPIYV